MAQVECADEVDEQQIEDINWILDRILCVPAWCNGAIGIVLADGTSPGICTSGSCYDHRVQQASALYDEGVRPPLKLQRFMTKIVIPSQSTNTEPPDSEVSAETL